MSVYAIIVAGGNSRHTGEMFLNSFWKSADGPCSLGQLKNSKKQPLDNIIVVTPEDSMLYVTDKIIDSFDFDKVIKIVAGGKVRQESVFNGLKSLPISTSFVAIHDGARPLVNTEDIDRVVKVAKKEQGAILASPVADTVKRVVDNYIITTVNREQLYCAQTPQVFQYDLIMEAHSELAKTKDLSLTDDAQLIEGRGFKVKIVVPVGINFKITTRQDMKVAEAILEKGING